MAVWRWSVGSDEERGELGMMTGTTRNRLHQQATDLETLRGCSKFDHASSPIHPMSARQVKGKGSRSTTGKTTIANEW